MNNITLQKFIIYGGLLLDVIGVAVLIPAFPELKTYYGINDFQVTLGLTIYSLCAFVAAPLMGQLSDRYGRKVTLIWCVAGTALSYIVLLLTPAYRIFLISRIINGITGGNISILQAVLTDISTTKEEKTKNFGIMGAIFGMGFIIGPIIGSLLLKTGTVHGIFRGGTILACIELIGLIFWFYNTNSPDQHKAISFNSFGVIGKYIQKKQMQSYLISLSLLGIGAFMVNATQSLYMNTKFGTSGEQYGYYLAILGVISALNMGLLVPKFWTKYFSTKSLILISHAALILGYFITGFITQERLFLGIFYSSVFLGNIYAPLYNSEIMSQAHPDEIGEISGMLGGIQSLFMFIGPLIGGILLSQHINVFIAASLCFTISIIVLYTHKEINWKK